MRPRKSEAGFANMYPPSPADFLFEGQAQAKQGGTTSIQSLVPTQGRAFFYFP
jgi:hypothetical protein